MTTKTPASGWKADGNQSLTVTFTFAEQWSIGPAGQTSNFPPGSGLGGENIQIAPLHLAGLSASEIERVISKRIGDLALVAQAIAVASQEVASALKNQSPAP